MPIQVHLPERTFARGVARYRGYHKVLGLTCLNQFLRMAFAQLTLRESLRGQLLLSDGHEKIVQDICPVGTADRIERVGRECLCCCMRLASHRKLEYCRNMELWPCTHCG
jgi:hypothetical protein